MKRTPEVSPVSLSPARRKVSDPILAGKNISVSLNGQPIVNGVDIHVAAGELVGLIGPNGAGKTTLVKVLANLLPHYSGSLEWQGKSIQGMKRSVWSRHLSYMAQGAMVHWPLRVDKVVSLGRLPHLAPWQKLTDADYEAIVQAMNDAEILHLSERIVTHLSAGERTLVMLARALAVNPKVLLADEPISGLDPNHQVQVMELLKNFALQGRGILVVLHDLTLAARFCDRVVLLKNGNVLSEGKPAEVLSPDGLREGYGIIAKYGRDGDQFYLIPWSRIPDGKTKEKS